MKFVIFIFLNCRR